MGERGALSFYRTTVGAEIDLLIERKGGAIWAIEIKRAVTPVISKGFHLACDDVSAKRRIVVHGGTRSFPMTNGIEAMSLKDAMRSVAED